MKIEYYTWNDFNASNWSGGKTTELFIFPDGASYKERTFIYRLSSATIEVPTSNFTLLEGIERFITPITHSLLLEDEKVEPPTLLLPFDVYKFDGKDKIISYGITRDFNLMLNKEKATGWMEISKKADSKTFSIGDERKGHIFLFNALQPSNIKINGITRKMDASSLLILKEMEKSIKLEFDEGIVYGLIKIN